MHEIPNEIVEKIESLCVGFDQKALRRAVERLTKKYGADTSTITALETYEEHLAYLICRMPATYAVNKEVFSKIAAPITSLLDVGAGPGTAYLAANPKMATLMDRDEVFIELAKKLLSDAPHISWQSGDICGMGGSSERFDVVSASYVLSELAFCNIEPVVEVLWQKTENTLVLIETGTPRGYQRLMQARSFLINNKATILHPCPHHMACPMLSSSMLSSPMLPSPQDGWCHFHVRIARSKLHRALKGAQLGYEDENFSYIIAARAASRLDPSKARLVGSVCKRTGHMLLSLCTPEGRLVSETVSRKSAERYKAAKKAHWGDLI